MLVSCSLDTVPLVVWAELDDSDTMLLFVASGTLVEASAAVVFTRFEELLFFPVEVDSVEQFIIE